MTSAVPELTCSGNIKLNKRLSLRRREDRIRWSHRTFPGSTVAKPSVEHIPADGFVWTGFRFHD